MIRNDKGFTLIELLIVVAIIGILAAIAIPNMLIALQRSRQKRTMADMRSIATAWEARATDLNAYNAAGAISTYSDFAGQLPGVLVPTYTKHFPKVDGWGGTFRYQTNGTSYLVWSGGKDKSFENPPAGGATTAFNSDIVFSNGIFIQYPEGVQNN